MQLWATLKTCRFPAAVGVLDRTLKQPSIFPPHSVFGILCSKYDP